jgi:Carbohydrate family 9 binding domain-like
MRIFYLLSTVFYKSAILYSVFLLLNLQNVWAQTDFRMPKNYTVQRTVDSLTIDGQGEETAWEKASWSNYFIDIEGNQNPKPKYATRLKMLWDNDYFYFYIAMEEPHIWGNLTQRDTVIFYDNDFEIFIDPDGDTHNYVEFEINALNTVWDLLLTRPYRDGGLAINSWDIKGLKSAVYIDGTINDPSDIDKGWSIEVAIPWKSLNEITKTKVPPVNGDQWRLNFSRVQWETEILDGKYVKIKDSTTNKDSPADNWVWTPQRAIAMHEPEFWGLVNFSDVVVGAQRVSIGINQSAEHIKQALYQIHRAQKSYKNRNDMYAERLEDLDLSSLKYSNGELMNPNFERSQDGQKYQVAITFSNQVSVNFVHPANKSLYNRSWSIDESGLLQKN